jgi:hypothetical protein
VSIQARKKTGAGQSTFRAGLSSNHKPAYGPVPSAGVSAGAVPSAGVSAAGGVDGEVDSVLPPQPTETVSAAATNSKAKSLFIDKTPQERG